LGWRLGACLCAGMAAAFVISRLFGLPNYREDWSSDGGLGLISLPPEFLFIVCMRYATPIEHRTNNSARELVLRSAWLRR
jgi:hypothetical protein